VIFRHAAAIEEALGNVETANDYRQKAKELSN